MINGIEQHPIEGVSMLYTWDKANADAPTRHTTQYFETSAIAPSITTIGWRPPRPQLSRGN